MNKYTFLLPAYKSRYFEEALVSIKNQVFTNFSVIVSDDCSPEPLKSVFDKVCSGDFRFTYRRNEINLGGKSLVAHWNLLLKQCNSDFFIMASDDDIYDPYFLYEIDKLSLKYPTVDLFRSRVRKINSLGDSVYEEGPYKEKVLAMEYIAQNYNNTSVHCVPQFVFRTSSLLCQGGFVEFPLALFSDDAAAIMMSSNGCVNTSDVLFSFRISGESISSSAYDEKKTKSLVIAALKYDVWFKKYMMEREASTARDLNLINFIWIQHRYVISSFFSWSVNCKWADFWHLCKLAKQQGIQTIGCKIAVIKNFLSIK